MLRRAVHSLSAMLAGVCLAAAFVGLVGLAVVIWEAMPNATQGACVVVCVGAAMGLLIWGTKTDDHSRS